MFRDAARSSIGSHMPAKSLKLKHTIKLIRELAIEIDEIEAAIKSKKAIDTHQKQAVNKKHHHNNEPVEVDLHIHELLDSTTGMSNADILNYQLDKFR